MSADALPPVYGISAAALFSSSAAFLKRLEEALRRGGLRLLQVRERAMEPAELARFARDCVARCHEHGCRVLLNAAPELAREAAADGVHLPSSMLEQDPRDYDGLLVGASCHDGAQLAAAFEGHGADFAVLSPVSRTASHPEAEPLGWDRFGELARGCGGPVYALGGMRLADLPAARLHGAAGIASMRDVWGLPASS